MNSVSQRLVFVSYAHADRQFLDEELVPFLKQLELGGQITFWEDSQIGTGETWYTEIADRLDNAKVAILLITPPFLGSKFCQLEEIPVLLQRARQGKLMLLPLLVVVTRAVRSIGGFPCSFGSFNSANTPANRNLT